MGITIRFKPIILKKALRYLVFIGTVVCFSIFMFIRIDINYLYFISMLSIFLGLLIAFYVNRNEPAEIRIEGEKYEFTYFNKVIFKKEICICQDKEMKSFMRKDDLIVLYKGNRLISNIRRSSLSNDEWEKVKVIFLKNN